MNFYKLLIMMTFLIFVMKMMIWTVFTVQITLGDKMEKPINIYQADLIEYASEHLQYNLEGWLLTGHEISEDIKKFYEWCLKQDKEYLHCKRGIDGKSFYERREEARLLKDQMGYDRKYNHPDSWDI